ncbi:hypothetical protein ACHAXR_004000 [Thalassiosira sp. AJA248-18]
MQRGNKNLPVNMKTSERHGPATASDTAAAASTIPILPPRSDQENQAQTLIATQTMHGGRVRTPLDPVAAKSNQVQPKDPSDSSMGKKKKLRPGPYNLRRNGVKSSSAISKENVAANSTMAKAELEDTQPKMKVPIDPPGAILGALPWMHHSNGQQVAPSAGDAANNGCHFYGGGGHQFQQPAFPPMGNHWGYQPSRQQVSQQLSQQWMPPFLRHPFGFMANNGNHDNTWTPSSRAVDQLAQIVHNALPAQHNSHVESNVNATHPPSSEADDADDAMSTDESMASAEDAEMPKEVETKFLPSTFAPPECVEEIRARMKAAAKVRAVEARQTRSMTAKKNRDRRDTLRSSASNSSRSKSNTNAVAHQACSPDVARGGKCSGSKVAAISTVVDSMDSPAPQVMTVLGKRVTMIDPVRKVFVIDLLSPEACDQIRMMADNHTRETGSNQCWRTLYTYTKMDLPVVEVKDLVKKYTDRILCDVKKIVGEIFGGSMKKEAMKLRPRSWKEPHLLLYQQLNDRPSHTGIEMHYDGCDITWQAMLTRLDEYEGGGTYFRCLRKTVRLQQGQVLVHPGELYHKGCEITYGVRCLLVCFTDGMNPKILDDSSAETDDKKYEQNVFVY